MGNLWDNSQAEKYGQTVQDFGLNYGSLYYYPKYSESGRNIGGRVEVNEIRNELAKAEKHSIRILLWNGYNFSHQPKRWIYKNSGLQNSPAQPAEVIKLRKGKSAANVFTQEIPAALFAGENSEYHLKVKMRLADSKTPDNEVLSVNLNSRSRSVEIPLKEKQLKGEWKEIEVSKIKNQSLKGEIEDAAQPAKEVQLAKKLKIDLNWKGNTDCDIEYVARE